MTPFLLRATAQLLGFFALIILGLFLAAVVRGFRWRASTELSAKMEPLVREALVHIVAGSEDLTRLQELMKMSRQDVAQGILNFQHAVSGSARDRVCALALDLQLVHDWREQTRSRDIVKRRQAYAALSFVCAYEPIRRVGGEFLEKALDDSDREVRLWAAQALAKFGSKAEIERIFTFALDENLLTRALLAGPLREHALDLCTNAVPPILEAGDSNRILGVLEVVEAWERALPIVGLYKLIESPDREVRIRALRTAPLVMAEKEDESAILRALVGSDVEVAMAAAVAAGRRTMHSALTPLARCLRSGNVPLARTAAAALLALPPKGQATLLELAESEDEVTANAANEALGRAPYREQSE